MENGSVSPSQEQQTVQNQQQNEIPTIPRQIDQSNDHLPLTNQIQQTNNNQISRMALTPGDILKGIPDFDPKSQDNVKKFMAQVDLMYLLAPNSNDTILAITRAKLVNANKLGTVTDKTWAQIKQEIKNKYRTIMTFEAAQEKLLSLQQGEKEAHDAYANRVRSLLDSINTVTTDNNADIQASNRAMNEKLAVEKFKQNIFDPQLRAMALSVDHDSLSDAIAHASSKYEQLIGSNFNKKEQPKATPEKKEQESEKQNKNTPKKSNWKNYKNENNNKNKNNAAACVHCKKNNHQSDQCYFRLGGPHANKNGSNEQPQNKSSNTAAALPQPNVQIEATATTSSAIPQQSQNVPLQPYHF